MASVLEMSGVIWGCWQEVTCPPGKGQTSFQAISHCSSCTFVKRRHAHVPRLQRWQTTEEMKMTWFLRAATSCLPCWLHTAGASWIRHEPGQRCLFTQTWFIKSEPGSFPRISVPERPALGHCNCPCWSLWEASSPSTYVEDSETTLPSCRAPPIHLPGPVII